LIALSTKWATYLSKQPETGMGYQFATIFLVDGRKFDRALIDGGYITRIGEDPQIPFKEADIDRIVVDLRREVKGPSLKAHVNAPTRDDSLR